MAHGIMIPSKIMAKNVDSLVRSAKATIDLDNGNIVALGGISQVAGEGEVFLASTPAASAPTDLWMVGEPEIVLTGSYKGLDPDVRNFYNLAGAIITVFKVKKCDIIRLTADNFSNARDTEEYADVATGSVELAWAASSTSASMFKLVEVTNIAIATGSPTATRVTAYRLEAIGE